jgi:hypothetical protein
MSSTTYKCAHVNGRGHWPIYILFPVIDSASQKSIFLSATVDDETRAFAKTSKTSQIRRREFSQANGTR